MAPDVILILIKEGRVVMGWGVLESILLNTINPFFIFEGNKGRREWIQAQRHALDHGSLFWRHGGRQPVIKEEAGPERLGQHLMPSIPPPWPDRGGVGSALPLVSLEMIACPGARREEAAQLHALFFLTYFF